MTSVNRTIYELPRFHPIKPYVLFYIHRTQAQFVFDELINLATKTKLFTIVPKNRSLYSNYMLIHVELIQNSQTIIALIEYSNESDRNSFYYHLLHTFFTILFDSSKTIQTWGNLLDQLVPYTRYGLFACSDASQAQSIDIQKQFKPWYNNIFRHNIQCHQYLKYDEIDSTLCTCAHRPYKSSSCQWSISKAIAYTFEERYDSYSLDIHKCIAITKLGHVIHEKWTSEMLKAYQQNLHINEKVMKLNFDKYFPQ
ncbi:unnamed protein product [Rotaria sp. Silwood1]|nr:unnamed protein product [Rotaria sp. Silwood1]CAF1634851.1 unnamed protein product [Rotaria sp. Silwood1]CAF4858717.1 unnamed protein product [Rotaria sp. Silwood1]